MENTQNYKKNLHFDNDFIVRKLSAHSNKILNDIANAFSIRIGARAHSVFLEGPYDSVNKASKLIKHIEEIIAQGGEITPSNISQAAHSMHQSLKSSPKDYFSKEKINIKGAKQVSPRGPGQNEYFKAINKNDLVIAIGPAGTGKTYLAMTHAVSAFLSGEVERIILTRPAVEAGEKLGFLPGTMEEKVSPFLRPLYDALFDLMSVEKAEKLVANGTIEVAPLAFMRGRTLNDAFVILDEAQNTTKEQMKMALTRLGFNSKMIITGDITQIDLPKGEQSGLVDAVDKLKEIKGLKIVYLSDKDVVRHPLVQSIIKAYENNS